MGLHYEAIESIVERLTEGSLVCVKSLDLKCLKCSKGKLSIIHNIIFSLLEFPPEIDLRLVDFLELLKKSELKDNKIREMQSFVVKNLQGYIKHTKALIA